MLDGQPSLHPGPNCMRLRAWSKHNADILAQIPHPDYPQHGWKGMVIQPSLFDLINTKLFVPPTDPGRIAIYPQFALAAQMKMIDAQFKLDMNMFKTYNNIKRALFYILQSVAMQYQASTTPGLSGWDPSMTIHTILAQLNTTYGKLPRSHVPYAPPAEPDPIVCVPSHRRMPGGGYPRREPIHGRAINQPSHVGPTQIEYLPN